MTSSNLSPDQPDAKADAYHKCFSGEALSLYFQFHVVRLIEPASTRAWRPAIVEAVYAYKGEISQQKGQDQKKNVA
jgi:hypothetical protein